MAKLFANSGDPDQTPCSVVSDLGLHCLPITLLRISRLQWVKKVISPEPLDREVVHTCPDVSSMLYLLMKCHKWVALCVAFLGL